MTQRTELVIPSFGDKNVFKVQTSTLPDLKLGEVTIEVKSAGINFADILARQGLYQDAPPLPLVVGYEVAGRITQVAPDVDTSWIGKHVFSFAQFGGYSSHINVPVNQLFVMPDSLDFHQAASIPVAYATAYCLVTAMGGLSKGETILIQNAGGGVGLAILDIAKKIGATTIGTASARKHEFLKERGLDYAIDYTKEDWQKRVMEITDGKGVELITDPLGGKSWREGYKLLRSTGRMGMFGVSDASHDGFLGKLKLMKTALLMPFFHPVSLMNDNRATFGVNMGRLWHETDKLNSWINELIEGIDEGWVRPHVDKVFPHDQVGEAHDYMEQRKNIGKVLISFND